MDWLDAARYADTNGYQNDFARTMWPWRDWVIASFNRNQPFDQFVIDQIAGDLVPGSTREQKVATGFNRNNRTVTEAGSIDEEWRIENAVDRVETTATVFLGLTMGCGRCHDHKYDPITQREFYQFLAFFNSVSEKGVYTEQRGNVPPLISVPDPDQEKELRRLNEALAAATKAHDEAGKGLAQRRKDWERKQASGPEPAESRDWSLRCLLDGSLHFQGPSGETVEGTWRGANPPSWTDGPPGKALRLDGKDQSFVEVERGTKPGPHRSLLLRRLGQALGRRRLPEQDGRSGRLPRLRPADRRGQGRRSSGSRLAGRRDQGHHPAPRCRRMPGRTSWSRMTARARPAD